VHGCTNGAAGQAGQTKNSDSGFALARPVLSVRLEWRRNSGRWSFHWGRPAGRARACATVLPKGWPAAGCPTPNRSLAKPLSGPAAGDACILGLMLRICIGLLASSFAAVSYGAAPIIDNERVTVWDATSALPPAAHDFVAVPLSQKGTALLGHQGTVPSKDGARTIVIELKDNSPARTPNNSGYPSAFPRPHSKKLLENDRVIVWDTVWFPGEPTPMHFHDKDALAVFESNGVVQSTTVEGKQVVTEVKFADVSFNRRNRTHSELLLSGHAHAIVIELK
jgi:hypothetical protein